MKELGHLKEAEISTRKAIQIKPDYAEAHYNLGVLLKELGNLKEAEISTRKAIELQPDYAEAHYNLSHILIKEKKFEEGFNRYEWRWEVRDKKIVTGVKLKTSKPEWTPNKRGRVLFWAEQGIGDEILFTSLIPELVKLVDQLIITVDERLIPLFKRSFDQRIVYINKNQLVEEEKYDFHIAMGSLPKFLRIDKKTFEIGKKKYLKVNEKKTNIFRDKLKDSNNKKLVGISWRSKSITNIQKSMSLEKFILGIYSPNICFVNLQYGDTEEEINNIKIKYNIDIVDLKEVDNFNNIDDLAALVNACDLVVSIENMIYALSGALGVESKILLTRNCIPYNGTNDLKSYWFENQTFYRQTSTEDWGKELSQVKNEIENLLKL